MLTIFITSIQFTISLFLLSDNRRVDRKLLLLSLIPVLGCFAYILILLNLSSGKGDKQKETEIEKKYYEICIDYVFSLRDFSSSPTFSEYKRIYEDTTYKNVIERISNVNLPLLSKNPIFYDRMCSLLYLKYCKEYNTTVALANNYINIVGKILEDASKLEINNQSIIETVTSQFYTTSLELIEKEKDKKRIDRDIRKEKYNEQIEKELEKTYTFLKSLRK